MIKSVLPVSLRLKIPRPVPHDVARVPKKPQPQPAPIANGKRSGAAIWLEWLAVTAVILVAVAALYRTFVTTSPQQADLTTFSFFEKRADMLSQVSDPIKRDSLCIPLSAMGRSVDAQLPTDARVFLLGELGATNSGNLGYYYFLNYYLFPREVAISLGEPAKYTIQGMMGREPQSAEELTKAGYDIALQMTPDKGLQSHVLKPLKGEPPKSHSAPLSGSDAIIAFLLPLAVALAGSRLVRWLFRDLEAGFSLGEYLACGLALGAFFSTQLILALRLAGARLEQPLAVIVIIWGLFELVLLFRRWGKQPPHFGVRQSWWLVLIPAALIFLPLFRLAGLEGLQEFDAIAFWAFKSKLFHVCAGKELWTWLKNPAMAYAHLDYPLLASLLHSFTYGAIGRVDEFVTKFWNQWMLVFLAWAVLGAARFPHRRPWLAAATAMAIVLLPMTLEFTRQEGGTIPMVFFAVLSSLQLALGMADKQPGRIRLGVLLLMGTAMVKFEGIMLLAFWGGLLLLDKDSRAALWPPKRIALTGLVGFAGWIPYMIFRLLGPVPHPESAWPSLLFKHMDNVLHIAPMTCLGFLSRRFLNNDFAAWSAVDNQHAVWHGKWMGLASLVDQYTLGIAWVGLFLLICVWWKGGTLRWTALRLFAVFIAFSLAIGVVWSSTHSAPLDYAGALDGSIGITGGRYLYPTLLSWFVGTAVLLARANSRLTPPVESNKSGRRS